VNKIIRQRIAASVAVSSVAWLGQICVAAEPSADSVFVGKVSQGGRYEVDASKLAEQRAAAPDVKDLATTEVHDHELVNAKLKKLADAAAIPVAPEPNSMFRQRLEKLRATPAKDFDAAYVEDMKQIHDKDEKLFAQEAVEGTGDFKPFAHETDLIVKRHIGALGATD
jgi:putative membrane protein